VTVCDNFLVQHGTLKVNMGGIQNRLIPQYTLKGEEASGGVVERVLGHL
jgi:hypothetical protein